MASYLARAAPRALRTALPITIRTQRPTLAPRAVLTPAKQAVPLLRRSFATATEQPRLRLGSVAPDFKAQTTHGDLNFHEWIGDSWAILFSHPADFTPVCTTELGAFAKLEPEFNSRNVKLIGLSANDLSSHEAWTKDINDIASTNLSFPIIADANRKIAYTYDMLDAQDLENIDQKGLALTIRSVFIIDPSKKIRLTMTYPASCGRNTAEVLRVVDALQLADKKGIATPINWSEQNPDVIIPVPVSTEAAKQKFKDVREVRPYLRFSSGELKSS